MNILLYWAELDLNQRSITQRIYNPPPLTTRAPTLKYSSLDYVIITKKSIFKKIQNFLDININIDKHNKFKYYLSMFQKLCG